MVPTAIHINMMEWLRPTANHTVETLAGLFRSFGEENFGKWPTNEI